MLVHSANLLMKMKGEQRGTGAGVGLGRHRNTWKYKDSRLTSLKYRIYTIEVFNQCLPNHS